jgi:DNA-binding MarR family transcriptional regulator
MAMNPVFFGLKRAFHGTLRIGRRTFQALGLTAARFDLLYALTDEGRPRETVTHQSELRRMLGVSRPAVSRMLRSLEELGFVRRKRSEADRRQLEVHLTILGRLRIRLAFCRLVRSGWSLVAPECALGWASPTERELLRWENCMAHTETLEPFLDDVRIAFRDFATLVYPWYPLED